MNQRPAITVSSRDAERLGNLLDGMPDDQFPGKDELLAELERADIVDSEKVPSNVVTMNSTVRFRVESSKREVSMTLVYPRDQGEGTISILAPVGSALLGMTEGGDLIAWPKPGGGDLSLQIIEVTYQPERAGDYHR